MYLQRRRMPRQQSIHVDTLIKLNLCYHNEVILIGARNVPIYHELPGRSYGVERLRNDEMSRGRFVHSGIVLEHRGSFLKSMLVSPALGIELTT